MARINFNVISGGQRLQFPAYAVADLEFTPRASAVADAIARHNGSQDYRLCATVRTASAAHYDLTLVNRRGDTIGQVCFSVER